MKNNFSLSHRKEEPEKGILYLVGTPIGNLDDISPRAINILANVSLIACEDTRQTKKIMNKFSIFNNLISFNKENCLNKISKLIEELKTGKSIALVSDAGMPGICDPGENDREKILFEISKNEKTTIVYESPHRLKKLLLDLLEFCGGEREIMVARELTKKFEEHVGNNINNAIMYFKDKEVKGEITLVIKGRKKENNQELNKSDLKRDLKELIKAGLSLSAASKYLAKKNGIKKSIIYNLN